MQHARERFHGRRCDHTVRHRGGRITGDAHEFILVATGRADPATFGLDETVNVYRG